MPVVKLDSFLTADVINGRIETVEMAEDGARDDGRVGGGGSLFAYRAAYVWECSHRRTWSFSVTLMGSHMLFKTCLSSQFNMQPLAYHSSNRVHIKKCSPAYLDVDSHNSFTLQLSSHGNLYQTGPAGYNTLLCLPPSQSLRVLDIALKSPVLSGIWHVVLRCRFPQNWERITIHIASIFLSFYF